MQVPITQGVPRLLRFGMVTRFRGQKFLLFTVQVTLQRVYLAMSESCFGSREEKLAPAHFVPADIAVINCGNRYAEGHERVGVAIALGVWVVRVVDHPVIARWTGQWAG